MPVSPSTGERAADAPGGGFVDPRWQLDPEIAGLLATGAPLPPALTIENLAERRARLLADLVAVLPGAGVTREDRWVPGPPGGPRVAVRLHRPLDARGLRPAVVVAHGGGYVMGSAAAEDGRLDRWCSRLGVVGVSVEYRLAPETAYPGALEDCYAALQWVDVHADELGVDRQRIGVFGPSAGGGLAASLALLARDRGEPQLAFQLLVFPMLDDRGQTPSTAREVPVWPLAANEVGWRAYLGTLYGTPDVPPTAAPARAGDLAGLPPAFVCVGTADIFCDEDIAYAQRLIQLGVPTELHVYPGAPHGFLGMFPTSSVARRCEADMDAWLGAVVGAPPA